MRLPLLPVVCLLSVLPVKGSDSDRARSIQALDGPEPNTAAAAAAFPGHRGPTPALEGDASLEALTKLEAEAVYACDLVRHKVELSLQTGVACQGCFQRLLVCTTDDTSERLLSSEPEPSSNSTTDGSEGGHDGGGWEAFVFFLVALTIGAGVLHLTMFPSLHALQFTVVLFVLGFGAGILAENSAFDSAPMLKRSFEGWMSLDPHLLLFAFLPPLLAGDAMTIDTHLAKRCAAQCLLLAGPGVLVGAFATAYVVYCLPYHWDFPTCLVVGSILAATDPVAVVGLLKDLGASPVLTILIQGESLLNDGTAIVLFTIAYEMVAGKSRTALEVVGIAVSSTIGAVAVGFTVGAVFCWWIKNASDRLSHHSSMIQISLTICCAYWSFMLAEGGLHWSGVLSTVTSALVLAHKMWPLIVEREAMLGIWHMIETIGNAIVFFLSGAMTGKAMLAIETIDFLWAFIVYLAITVIRLVMMLTFWPLLRKLGQDVSGKDVLMMSWGGLRGMVGLALAILVQKEQADGHLSPQDGDRILFLVGCIASFTLIINATTSPTLATTLGILQAPQGRNVLIRNVTQRVRGHMEDLVSTTIKDNAEGTACVPAIVKEMIAGLLDEVDHHFEPETAAEDKQMPKRSGTRSMGKPGDVATLSHSKTAPADAFRQAATGWGRQTSADSAYSQTSTGSAITRRVLPFFATRNGSADVDGLFKKFDELKLELLQTGVPVTPFKFGKELDQIKNVLYTQQMNMQQLRTVREVFLEVVRANYWEQMESGRFVAGSAVPQILLNSINLAKEEVGEKIADWKHVHSCIKFSTKESQDCALALTVSYSLESVTAAKKSQRISDQRISDQRRRTSVRAATASLLETASEPQNMPWIVAKIWNWYQHWRVKENYRKQSQAIQVINSFIEAHQAAQEKIASYFGDDEDVDSPEEAYVIIESQIEVYLAAIMRGLINNQVLKRVNTMWKLHQLAEHYSQYIHRVHATGVMNAKEAEALLHPVQHMQRTMRSERRMKLELEKMGDAVARYQAAVAIQRWSRRSSLTRTSTKLPALLESHALEEGAGCANADDMLDARKMKENILPPAVSIDLDSAPNRSIPTDPVGSIDVDSAPNLSVPTDTVIQSDLIVSKKKKKKPRGEPLRDLDLPGGISGQELDDASGA